MFRAGAAWTETGVTWNTQPATAGTAVTASSGTGWLTWGVTDHVSAMYSGSNYGFIVRDSVESSSIQRIQEYSSREGANRPELVITLG